MRFNPLFARGRTLAAIALVGAVVGLALGVGLKITVLQSHGETTSHNETQRTTPEECAGFGIASFTELTSLDDLIRSTDVVVKGRITARSNAIDTFGPEGRSPVYSNHRFIFYTVDVLDVLVGDVSGESITLGMSFGEACLDPAHDYYLFMGREREKGELYVDDPGRFDNPAEYGLHGFGPQNVFPVESGVVRPLRRYPKLEQFHGISEDLFRNAVIESVARIR